MWKSAAFSRGNASFLSIYSQLALRLASHNAAFFALLSWLDELYTADLRSPVMCSVLYLL